MAEAVNYYKKWYDENGSDMNAARRKRYAEDSKYRRGVLARNRAARELRREADAKDQQARRGAKKVATAPAWKTVQQEVVVGGKTIVATLFTIGALAKRLGRGISTVRVWERQGLLPETPYRSPKGDRLYTLDLVESIRRTLWEMGKLTNAEGKLRQKRRPDASVKWVRFSDGQEKLVPLYKFGVLAQAVGRTVVALAQMEKSERLPITPLRASSLRYRLYTVEMVEIVSEAFRKRGSTIRSKYEWRDLRNEVDAGWRRLGVDRTAIVMDKEQDDDEGKSSGKRGRANGVGASEG